MASIFAVYAYDNLYGGLHGMGSYSLFIGDSLKEVEEYAADQSREVIESYENIQDSLTDQADEMMNDDDTTYDEAFEQAIEEDIAYEVYRLNIDADNISDDEFEELEKEWYDSPDEFLQKYENKNCSEE